MSSSDPRRRRNRHILTPDTLSTSIQISNLPVDWTQDTVTSVIAGSGRIVDILPKMDPRNGKLNSIIYDYITSRDCSDAFGLISKIEKFPCEIERIIPKNYKEKLELNEKREPITLNRDSYPIDFGLELPFQMITEVPLPRKSTFSNANNATNTTNSNNLNINVTFPDILSKATKHLPVFQENVLQSPDKISENLSKIPPLQLIEFISNLKILANQGSSKRSQLEQFLTSNDELTLVVSQALLEMGFINQEVVIETIRSYTSSSGSNNNSSRNTPSNQPLGLGNVAMNLNTNNNDNNNDNNNNNNMSSFTNQIQAQPTQAVPPPFGFTPFMPMPSQLPMPVANTNASSSKTTSNISSGPPQFQPIRSPPATTNVVINNNSNSNGPMINYAKLQQLPANQQDMIKQVLTLDSNQIKQLPQEQQTMVNNFKAEYLL